MNENHSASPIASLPCGCKAVEGDDGAFRIVGWRIGCEKRHKMNDVTRVVYTVSKTVTERCFFNPDEIRREFGEPMEGESYEDFVIRVFERFDGSVYGDEMFPNDANPQVGHEVRVGWDDD